MAEEVTIEEKLRVLYDLQLIDSRIDKIKSARSELPLEVEDLEDEIMKLETKVSNFNEEITELDTDIKNKENIIKETQEKIKKYENQQKKVRNNREFNAISKEIEYQQLEMELARKRIKESKAKMEDEKKVMATYDAKLDERRSHLQFKKPELDTILKEIQKEEEGLLKKSEEYSKMIEEQLINSYRKIRNHVKNGLAVVPIERGASGGSFFTIPPQRQLEIASRKKIIIDEHSGRILVDLQLAQEEGEKMQKLFSNLSKS